MEIKCIEKTEKKEYPKINEISNKRLKSSIPKKWSRLGISIFVFNMILRNKTFAVIDIDTISDKDVLGGEAEVMEPVSSVLLGPCYCVLGISFLSVVITSIMMIIEKNKIKKQKEERKVNKKIKVCFGISTILLIISAIFTYVIEAGIKLSGY